MTERKLKVAVFHNLPSGGAKRAVYELTRGLVERGHDLHEFRLSTADATFKPLTALGVHETVVPFSSVPYLHVPIPGVSPHVNSLARILTLKRLQQSSGILARNIDRGGFDVVWVNDCMISLKPFMCRYLCSPNLFFTHHGAYGGRFETVESLTAARPQSVFERVKRVYYAPTSLLLQAYVRRNEVLNARAPKYVLTNSFFAAESYFQHFGVSSRVLYYGVDGLFKPNVEEKSDYVLSVGALVYHKGYRFLIHALSKLNPSERPRLLAVANFIDPEEYGRLQRQAAAEDVRFEVRQIWDDRELAQIYRAALVFVYAPILEPFGLAPLEAMACGTPVVAVKEGGPREIVLEGNTGYLVERDPDLFADSLRSLLKDAELRDRLGRHGAEVARLEWTWAKSVDRFEMHLRSVASNP